MQKTKWFASLKAGTSVRTAARTILDARAAGVSFYLSHVVSRPGQNAEDVHQLRVATRRLAAALSIFNRQFGRRTSRKLRRVARRLRRASGTVRDLDVLFAMFESHAESRADPASAAPAIERCRAAFNERRHAALQELTQIAAAQAARFQKAADAARADLQQRPARGVGFVPRLASVARKILPKRLRQLLAAADADLNDLDVLHQLRIAAKRLRYAMEAFAFCFPIAFRRDLYAQVEAVQEDLGTINDLRNLRDLLLELNRSAGRGDRAGNPALGDLTWRLDREIAERRAAFIRMWQAEHRTLGQRFQQILSRPHLKIVRPPRAATPRRKL